MPEKKINWVNGIDSIRFVLALIVLLSHLHNPYIAWLNALHTLPARALSIFISHMFCGAAAVTAFFIISGFVIHFPNRSKTEIDLVPFLVRRWVRVGIPMVVVSLAAAHYHLFGILPLWSLYCELFYYTIYPILFKINLSWKGKLYIAYTVSAILILLFIADGRHWLAPHVFFTGIKWYLAIAIINLPCWVLGVLLANIVTETDVAISAGKIWGYRLLVYALSMVFVALKMYWHIHYTYSLIVFALLLYKWLQQEVIYHQAHQAHRFIEYLGKFSYSMYLCHVLWFVLIVRFFPDNVYTWAVYIILSVSLSYLVYLVIEYPSHRLAQKLSLRLATRKL